MPDRQTTIGAFVLGGIVLGLGAIIFFGNLRLWTMTTRAAVVFEQSISGLSIGAPVTFRGVRVGTVESIVIQYDAKAERALIPVTLRLEPDQVRVSDQGTRKRPDLPALIDRGLRAELNTQSLVTGQSVIDLDFHPETPAVLHPGNTNLVEIPTRKSTIQRVTQQLSELRLRELVENAIATLDSIRKVSERLDADLPALIGSVRATSDNTSRTIESAGRAIAQLEGRLDSTLGQITQLAANADRQLDQRSADLNVFLTSTNQAVLEMRGMLNEVKGLTSNRAPARVNLEATLRDLAATAASLRGFARDVERNPQLLLTGRRP
jgi:paraquat-inducible protein B